MIKYLWLIFSLLVFFTCSYDYPYYFDNQMNIPVTVEFVYFGGTTNIEIIQPNSSIESWIYVNKEIDVDRIILKTNNIPFYNKTAIDAKSDFIYIQNGSGCDEISEYHLYITTNL